MMTSLAVGAGARAQTVNDVALESSRGGDRRISQYRGTPVIVVEENRAAQGRATAWMQRLVGDPRFPSRARVVVVADVSGYHFWPAEGFVRAAVRERARHDGLEILIDWDGRLRRQLGFVEGVSNLCVLGEDGGVRLRLRGPFADEARGPVLAALQ